MVRRRESHRVLKYFRCEKLFYELGSGNSGGIHESQRGVSDRRGGLDGSARSTRLPRCDHENFARKILCLWLAVKT